MAEKIDLENMTPEQRASFVELAQAAMDHVNEGNIGDTMTCLACGKPVRIEREPMSWSVECTCGWSAAGSGPPARKN